ncbi:unnamed protein product [Rotaria sp. Silwood2]|nr:unnamed protein product [Rotaria sp. Silwood2]CAF2951861.1 unnamed protein product [Rotaria sp. Silwood2]CAF3108072.1 unnamed protein product [Rotaria sp. Silwood2]CAF4200035.1 unnamed protein product [Rotaria sp. Silwood2]CAF4265883.1 unnamed protein product [Rotaria sp. Silwood2]
MPGIHLFGRRFNFASDDLTVSSLIDIGLRLPLLVTFIAFRLKDESPDSTCPSTFYNGYFYPLLSVYTAITITASFMFIISLRGTPVRDTRPRRHMPLLIYIRLFLVLIDIGINIMGLIIMIRVFHMCAIILRATIVTTIVLSWTVAIALFIVLAFFIDLTGFVTDEKKWEMRIKLIFCCGRGYGGQSSNIKNIVKTLQYLFDNERVDLVPSDVAAGLILLQQEDSLEERSINITQNVPLELLKEGFYYNSYAQSAFGWFSLAYQYRLTFLPRILFITRFRTMGSCCGCCVCCSPCCRNQDILNDPCGTQYATLRYLLRRQNPVILYANFLGAFHRAPFYIAADNEKKTIIVSIRGTLSATDVLTDINVVEDALETELFGSGYCHSGMHSAAKYILDDISTRLTEIFTKYPDYTLIICGYSLGAGIGSILSIKLKSKYPHLKCYGIAMPGSVLSENLALTTRHFIYSYVVDVDMIARASIRSLEHLRDRIIDALNKYNRNKICLLTMTLARTIAKRRQTFHSINYQTQTLIDDALSNSTTTVDVNSSLSQLVVTHHSNEHVHLVMPGTIIHLYSTHRVGLFSRGVSYRAGITTYDQFFQLIVHPRMWLDHFPASYGRALANVIENYDQNSQQIA